jgi:hypothetical protein
LFGSAGVAVNFATWLATLRWKWESWHPSNTVQCSVAAINSLGDENWANRCTMPWFVLISTHFLQDLSTVLARCNRWWAWRQGTLTRWTAKDQRLGGQSGKKWSNCCSTHSAIGLILDRHAFDLGSQQISAQRWCWMIPLAG